jgi:hypothetical protein
LVDPLAGNEAMGEVRWKAAADVAPSRVIVCRPGQRTTAKAFTSPAPEGHARRGDT